MEKADFHAKGAIAFVEAYGGTVVNVFSNSRRHGDECDVANEAAAA